MTPRIARISCSLIVFLLGLFISRASADEINPKEPRWRQLSLAYGFYAGQELSLRRIAADFPDLAQQVKRANATFAGSALGRGARALDGALAQEVGDEWPDTRSRMIEEMRGAIDKQLIDRATAEEFLKSVEARSKGEIPESLLKTLLATNPDFFKSPAAEMAGGWRQSFSAAKHPKSDNAPITLSFPTSWTSRDSNRDGIVQVFRSHAGHGPLLCNVICKKVFDDTDDELTDADMAAMFTEERIRELIPEGQTVIEVRPMKIAGAMGGFSLTDLVEENLEHRMKMRSASYTIFQKKHFIQINFLIMEQFTGGQSLPDAYTQYKPTFLAIMSTLARTP